MPLMRLSPRHVPKCLDFKSSTPMVRTAAGALATSSSSTIFVSKSCGTRAIVRSAHCITPNYPAPR